MNCRITRTKSGKDYPKIAPGWGIIGRKKMGNIERYEVHEEWKISCPKIHPD
jgi:hypothetical protein